MPVKLEITMTGNIQKKLKALVASVEKLAPVLKDIGEEMLSSTQDRFKEETSPTGKKWQKLSPGTLKRKKNPKILQEMGSRGGLLDTIAYQVRPNDVIIGSNRVYAAIHHLGGRAGRGRSVLIPARPYLGLSRTDEQDIVEIFSDHLSGSL